MDEETRKVKTLEECKILVDVFKGYFDTALTANIWFYAFTGGMVTFYLSQKLTPKPVESYLKYSLFFPVFVGGLLILRSLVGMRQAYELRDAMLSERTNSENEGKSQNKWTRFKYLISILFNHPERQIKEPPVEILVGYLRSTIIAVCLVCAALIFLFCWESVND
jgi:hypothetical protein